MSTNFTSVTIRENSGIIDSSWWNALRTAGASLEAIVTALVGGGGSTSEQTLALSNNVAATTLTGMLAVSTYKTTRWRYTIKRIGTNTVMEHGELVMLYDGTNFELFQAWFVQTSVGASGVTFTNVAGQVKYATTNLAGHVSSNIYWTAITQG